MFLHHFGSKLSLYREVYRSRNSSAVEQRKAGLALAHMEDETVASN